MMKVELLAHTQMASRHTGKFIFQGKDNSWIKSTTDGQMVSLAAIRQCYSHKTALEVLETESEKYFSEKGQEAKRLFNHIVKSGHTSTLEHLNFTFAIEGVSRSLLAQLTRHRHMSFSVQSQRYVKFSSESRSNGFEYVVPEKIKNAEHTGNGDEVQKLFNYAMEDAQKWYDMLVDCGVSQENARAVLPNAATCNLVLTANLRTILEFYRKRSDKAAQAEIQQLADELKVRVIEVEPWTEEFFE